MQILFVFLQNKLKNDMKHIKIYSVAILALFGVSSISAQDIDEVIKEATVNIDSLITEANNGNEDAILELSFEYYRGKNVEEDEDKAFELAASIADKNEKALLLVANYLYYGAGTAPDQEGAKIILRQLSKKGNEKATSFLAKIEEDETYTVKNLEYVLIPNLINFSTFMPDVLTEPDSWKELLSAFGKEKFDFSWEDISAEEVKIGKEQHMYVYTLPTSDEVPSIIFGAIYLNDKNNDNRYIVLEKAYNQLGVEHLALRTYNNEMDCLLDEPFKGAITKANFIKLAKKEIKKPVPIKEISED